MRERSVLHCTSLHECLASSNLMAQASQHVPTYLGTPSQHVNKPVAERQRSSLLPSSLAAIVHDTTRHLGRMRLAEMRVQHVYLYEVLTSGQQFDQGLHRIIMTLIASVFVLPPGAAIIDYVHTRFALRTAPHVLSRQSWPTSHNHLVHSFPLDPFTPLIPASSGPTEASARARARDKDDSSRCQAHFDERFSYSILSV